jgi:glutathione peroxidase
MSIIEQIAARTIGGREIDLAQFSGKVLLIVNVASRCGFTSQYNGLQALYEKYRAAGLEILAFPCDDFGGQEPGSEAEIMAFCQSRYGVTFPLFAKISVAGDDAHPLYRALYEARLPAIPARGFLAMMFEWCKPLLHLFSGTQRQPAYGVQWNFHKFLLARAGAPVAHFSSTVAPSDPLLTKALEQELARPI